MRSLGNGYLKAGDEDFIMKPVTNFLRRSGFEKKVYRFLEVQARIFNAWSLKRVLVFMTVLSIAQEDRKRPLFQLIDTIVLANLQIRPEASGKECQSLTGDGCSPGGESTSSGKNGSDIDWLGGRSGCRSRVQIAGQP
jgi:hypothetical protein